MAKKRRKRGIKGIGKRSYERKKAILRSQRPWEKRKDNRERAKKRRQEDSLLTGLDPGILLDEEPL